MKIGFIGAGKVGFSLGKFFTERNIPVIGYCSRSIESAKEAAKFTNTKCYASFEPLAHDSDALFLTVPDDAIVSVYDELKKFNISGKHICHTSGSIGAKEAFQNIREYGAYGYSIHPLFPINDKFKSYRELSKAFFCIEGDKSHIGEWEALLLSLGVKVQVISSKDKARYHAAASIASNLVCALVEEAVELMEACGFTEENALEALSPLMQSNLKHIIEDSPIKALTGPIERGDTKTVESHLNCFDTKSELTIYRSLAEKLVDMAKKKHSGRDFSAMEKLLQTYSK